MNAISFRNHRGDLVLENIQEVLEKWVKMDDIKEIVIVGKTDDNKLRYYTTSHEDPIWWMGALTDVIGWFRDQLYYFRLDVPSQRKFEVPK